MNRSEYIENFKNFIKSDDVVVASTGFISREIYKQMDRDLNFYMMGSMGCALGIGIGIAKCIKSNVWVVNGDASCLMSLGTIITFNHLKLKNLEHIILNNGCNESTGGQPTNFGDGKEIFTLAYGNTSIFKCELDETIPPRIPLKPTEITERFRNAVKSISYK